MAKKRKDIKRPGLSDGDGLPAKADNNPDTEHVRYRGQEEYDQKGRNEQEAESEVRNKRESERLRDSQQGDERMLPETKKKQTPRDYRDDRKLPQIKR